MDSHRPEETLIFDNFDLDLLVKVLENTAFSESPSLFNGIVELTKLLGPFFLFFIPIFYFFHGAKISDPSIVLSSIYFISATIFCKFACNYDILPVITLNIGFVKWCSRLYRNQGSLIFAPPRLDWSEQIVVLTGGASGIGELLANTLAVRNVTVVVLDIKPIVTDNGMILSPQLVASPLTFV